MKNRRYSDKNYNFWPFTLSITNHGWYGIVLDSGAFDDEPGSCHIKLYLGNIVLICELFRIISDFRVRYHAKSWDAATIARLGRDWYEEHFEREYGFIFTGNGAVHVYYGPQTDDSRMDKNKIFYLPWRSYKFFCHRYFDRDLKIFWTEYDGDKTAWSAQQAVKEALPKVYFQIEDYDGEIITATTYVEEREWHFGTGICSFFSWFTRPKIRRSLAINFSAEMGKEKGSWKGGILGHGIEMQRDESHQVAFARYCEQEFRSKSGKFHIRNLGRYDLLEASESVDDGATKNTAA